MCNPLHNSFMEYNYFQNLTKKYDKIFPILSKVDSLNIYTITFRLNTFFYEVILDIFFKTSSI